MSPIDPDNRPRPLHKAAIAVARGRASIGGLLTAAAGFGLMSAVQVDAVTAALGAIPGIIAAATGVLAAFGVVKQAEPKVTPIESPAILDESGEYVALVPDEGRHARD